MKASTLTLPFVLIQSQRSTAAVPPWPAQGHHFCPSLEGRHHHQALAGPAGEEPAGGTGHRSQRHSSSSTVTLYPWPTFQLKEHQLRTAQQPSLQSWTLLFLWETVEGRKGCCPIIFGNRCADCELAPLWFGCNKSAVFKSFSASLSSM